MSNNKKYYYLKLKENFFNSDEIILIESMQDGMLFSNILLKLYLLSLKFNGFLRLNENMNYTAQMIATLGASDEIYGIDAAVDMVKFMIAAYESNLKNGSRVEIDG